MGWRYDLHIWAEAPSLAPFLKIPFAEKHFHNIDKCYENIPIFENYKEQYITAVDIYIFMYYLFLWNTKHIWSLNFFFIRLNTSLGISFAWKSFWKRQSLFYDTSQGSKRLLELCSFL